LDKLLGAIEDASGDGLLPTDYHLAELRAPRGNGGDAAGIWTYSQPTRSFGSPITSTAARWIRSVSTRTGTSRVSLNREEAVGVLLDAIDRTGSPPCSMTMRPRQVVYQDLRHSLAVLP
jgi:hypothetical protein